MDFAGIRRLKGSCPVGGERVERVKIATAFYVVERYRCAEHGVMTYVNGSVRDVKGPELAPALTISAGSALRTRSP